MDVRVIRLGEQGKRHFTKVECVTDQDFKDLIDLTDDLREQFPQCFIFIGTFEVGPPPADFRPRNYNWWCPFCQTVRRFGYDEAIMTRRCEACGLTDHDTQVRHYNHITE